MSIDVELALVLGLFIIGALVLAIDNLVYTLSRRLTRWMRNRRAPSTVAQSLHSTRKAGTGE
jgi:hypothetical protein